MKKFIALALAAMMLLSLVACGENTDPTKAPTQPAGTEATTKAPDKTEAANPDKTTAAQNETKGGSSEAGNWETKGLPAVTAGCLEGRIAITSIGQSADVDIIMKQLKKLKIDYYESKLMEASQLTTSYPILICVVGGSTKGLGGAGLQQEDEEARVKALLEKAVELKTTVLMIHNGGVDRRGTLSDAFIKLAFPYSTYAIVKLEGDTDNLMHDILAAKNVPSAFVEKDADVQAVMKYMFGK